ncbi:MAG: 50S ribosomal protein L15 [Patescibacteria group bacterium]
MTISLSNLSHAPGAKKKIKRIGRGNASGHGTTATRGTKGQRARSGGRAGLRAMGMRRMIMALPKMGGFKSKYAKANVVTLKFLALKAPAGTVNQKILSKLGIVESGRGGIKILDSVDFKLEKKYDVSGCEVSAGARAKIEAAGGTVA